MSTTPAPQPDIHLRRITVIWVVLSVVAVLLILFVLGPHMPPGDTSAQAHEQREANTIITAILAPIAIGLLVYFAYALRTFRQRDEFEDGPALYGDGRMQGWWIGISLAVVLTLAAYGTYALYTTESAAAGSGGGQGPTLISSAPADALQVQVVSQQWQFTFRYPQYGGVETTRLALPVNRTVVFHVTSLDVIHSFWAYQLGVKVDAVPGADNVADVTPSKVGSFTIRCAELCGVWHGAMHTTGEVVPAAQFASWIAHQRAQNAGATSKLPPYSKVYYPDPIGRAG